MPDLRRLLDEERPAGMADGWTFTAPVVDMPVYLAWLRARLAARGVDLVLSHVQTSTTSSRRSDVVINCTGLGAATCVDDHDLEPVRGQVS